MRVPTLILACTAALVLAAVGAVALYLASVGGEAAAPAAPGNYILLAGDGGCVLRAEHPEPVRQVTIPGGRCTPTNPALGLAGGLTVETPACGRLAFVPAPNPLLVGVVNCKGCESVGAGCGLRRMSGTRLHWQIVERE